MVSRLRALPINGLHYFMMFNYLLVQISSQNCQCPRYCLQIDIDCDDNGSETYINTKLECQKNEKYLS